MIHELSTEKESSKIKTFQKLILNKLNKTEYEEFMASILK